MSGKGLCGCVGSGRHIFPWFTGQEPLPLSSLTSWLILSTIISSVLLISTCTGMSIVKTFYIFLFFLLPFLGRSHRTAFKVPRPLRYLLTLFRATLYRSCSVSSRLCHQTRPAYRITGRSCGGHSSRLSGSSQRMPRTCHQSHGFKTSQPLLLI
jgi:hypothetical protein